MPKSSSKRHVVLLAEYDPNPPDTGGKFRDSLWISILEPICDLETLWISQLRTGKNHPANRLLSIFRSYPENGFNRGVADSIRRAYRPGSILLVSTLAHGKYIKYAKNLGYHVLLDEHNVESDLIRQMLPQFTQSPYRWYQYHRLARTEKNYCIDSDGVICVSSVDRDLVSQWTPKSKLFTMPNLIRHEEYSGLKEIEKKSRILFLGTLDYYPNQTGLLWFLDHILPILNRSSPALRRRITVAGRNPPASLIDRLRSAEIELIANPTDPKNLLQESSLMIVPLLHGGGTRIKILEAFASGCVVLSTTKGAEGIPADDGIITRADDPESFARAMIDTFDGETPLDERRRRGDTFIRNYLRMDTYRTDLENFIDRISR